MISGVCSHSLYTKHMVRVVAPSIPYGSKYTDDGYFGGPKVYINDPLGQLEAPRTIGLV